MIASVNMTTLLFAASLMLALTSSVADAVCMSCISRTGSGYTELACEGDSKFDVIHKCGQPDYIEEGEEIRSGTFGSAPSDGKTKGGFNVTTENTENFYYNCGQGRFIKILTFRGSTLVSIQEGSRGSGDQRCW